MTSGEPVFPRQSNGSQEASEQRAKQRTFFAWRATGVSIMTCGFVIALVEGLLHELGGKDDHRPPVSSFTLLGVALAILGFIVMGEAFFRAFRVDRSLDEGRFRPRVWYPAVVTCLACLLGICVALALWMTG
jgi:uncharacterized membrane protein YidH (DUF202 family)